MPNYNFIDEASVFEPGSVKIAVTNNEHHGKVWLHSHTFFEFVYIDKGFSLHSYNGKTTVLTAGDLFALCPQDVHSYNSAYHTCLYNCLFYLEELGDLKEQILRLPGLADVLQTGKSELPILRVGLSERRDLVLLFEKMRWERQNKGLGWELHLKSYLLSFLIFYARLFNSELRQAKETQSGYVGYIYKVLQYIEDNYAEEITNKDIADTTGLSPDYIAKQFKSVLSMTPAEYIRKFRVAKAMELLKTTDYSVAEIAFRTGFGDISLFSRVFKQIIGVSPNTFRKNGDSE